MSKKFCKIPIIVKSRFISALIASCGITLGLSFIFPLSNFSVYLTSYIHLEQSFVTMHYGLFLNLIFVFSTTLGFFLGGIIEQKIGFIYTPLTGLGIILVGNVFFIRMQNIWLCYILTFIMGTGSGISNSLLGKNLALYKPNIKGLLIGIFMATGVICGGIFATAGEKIISPSGYTLGVDEEFYPAHIAKRTYLYFMLGFIAIPFSAIIFILFIVEYKKEYAEHSEEENINKQIKEKEEEKDEEKKNENNIINQNEEENNVIEDDIIKAELRSMSKKKNIKKVFKTFRFWRLTFAQLFLNFSFSFILGTGRTFGALIGIDGSSLQFLMLLQSGALIIVGPILGYISDKKNPLIILRIGVLICMLSDLLLTFFTENTIIFIASFVIAILGLVAGIVGIGPFIMEIYGIQESVIVVGVINVFTKISEIVSTVSAFIISLFYTKEEIIQPYKIMYISGAICCFLSFILLLFEKNKKYVYEEEDDGDLGKLVDKERLTEAIA